MENASKALLMAACFLIGILILSLAVYLFISFGSTSAEIHKKQDQQQIQQFNNQFTSYIGKESITIYDVISIANLATENNIYYELSEPSEGEDNYISVILENSNIAKGFGVNIGNVRNEYNLKIFNELKNITDTGALPKYSCKVEISKNTQRVFKVIFVKK